MIKDVAAAGGARLFYLVILVGLVGQVGQV